MHWHVACQLRRNGGRRPRYTYIGIQDQLLPALGCGYQASRYSCSEARPCDRVACHNRHLTDAAEAACAGTWKHPSAELRLRTASRTKGGPSCTAVWMTSSPRWRHQDRDRHDHRPGEGQQSRHGSGEAVEIDGDERAGRRWHRRHRARCQYRQLVRMVCQALPTLRLGLIASWRNTFGQASAVASIQADFQRG
jgi:hypothetical protein